MTHLGKFLRIMVILSAMLLLIGGIIFLASQGHQKPDYHQFDTHVSSMGKGIPLMKTGIALLALTPLLATFFIFFVFLMRRNWLYVIISFIVIAILIFSIFMTGV